MRTRYLIATTLLLAVIMTADHGGAVAVRDAVFSAGGLGKVVFSHKVHMQQKGMQGNCRACHPGTFSFKGGARHYTMKDMAQGKSCGACHNGTAAFDLKQCGTCHRTSDYVYRIKTVGKTLFSHKQHLKDTPDCNSCHPALFDHAKKRVTMAEMERGKSCGACHNGNRAFSLKECDGCHHSSDHVYTVKATGKTIFSHKAHYKATPDCHLCHPTPFDHSKKRYTMADMEKGKSCGACHNGKKGFALKDCERCHPTRELNFNVPDFKETPFSHTAHRSMYRCEDCHTAIFLTARSTTKITMDQMGKGKSCGVCHDGKTAFSVAEKCDKCHR